MPINLPNQITLGRLGLAIIFFVLLSFYGAAGAATKIALLNWCFWIFLAAAIGDVLDGLLARAMKQVTSFGRVVDPVVDKVMVCGAFAFFASSVFYDAQVGGNITGVAPWMVVVILIREMLVSAIRSYSETHGQSFAANWAGKLKMFVQSAAVCVVLGQLAWYPHLAWLRTAAVWVTVVVTVLSIVTYINQARTLLFSHEALTGQAPLVSATTAPPGRPDRSATREDPLPAPRPTTGASA